MSGAFEDAASFNDDISAWDTSNVTNLANAFAGAILFNVDISGWNTSKVTNMEGVSNEYE
jgi:surface protein